MGGTNKKPHFPPTGLTLGPGVVLNAPWGASRFANEHRLMQRSAIEAMICPAILGGKTAKRGPLASFSPNA